MARIVIFVSFLLLAAFTTARNLDQIGLVKTGIRQLLSTGLPPPYLIDTLKSLNFEKLFERSTRLEDEAPQLCDLCSIVVEAAKLERSLGAGRDIFSSEAALVCNALGAASERVCNGIVDLNVDLVLYMIDYYPGGLPANRVCGLLSPDCLVQDDGSYEWSINIPAKSSAVTRRNGRAGDGPLNILQMSDFHFDPNYKPYGNAVCGEPICCQTDQGEPATPEDACGYWTDYRSSDTPWHLLEEVVRQVNTHELDYVYCNGDMVSHRLWDTTIEANSLDIIEILTLFRRNFKVPVYPVFGNHEPSPLNTWSRNDLVTPSLTMEWLFQLAADEFATLAQDDTIKDTIRQGGYYTTTPRPGLRIIALNNNVCYRENFWLIFDDVDPYGQLQWLADTLKQAEDDGESVHLLSHLTTTDCIKTWAREYNRILDRFQETITGNFIGHSHKDQLAAYYSGGEDFSRPISVAFSGGSLTPFTDSNPSYKVYQVDDQTFDVLNFQEWTFNLTLANLQGADQAPGWFQLYDFVETYGVEDLSRDEIARLLVKMSQNHDLLETYSRYKSRNSDAGFSGCDESCRKDMLCEIVTTMSGENDACDYFTGLFDQVQI